MDFLRASSRIRKGTTAITWRAGGCWLRAGDSMLDFGCSWWYGSWQLLRAGFHVFSFESRVDDRLFASTKLGCEVVENEVACGPVDCLFSVHVWEHLPDPNLLWEKPRC